MRLLAAMFPVLVVLVPVAAHGQSICGPRERFIEHLGGQKYGETPSAMGLTSNGAMVEVLTNPETGTWTIIVSQADGTACAIAIGKHWQQVMPQVATKPGVGG